MTPTNFLMTTRLIEKLHQSLIKEVCDTYQLTPMEANIISFLHNNPGFDTAADIVELRMFSKGNVSQGVDALIHKNLLKRTPDLSDRRKLHLALLPDAAPVTDAIDAFQEQLAEELFHGFTPQEIHQFIELNQRLLDNVQTIKQRREHSNE